MYAFVGLAMSMYFSSQGAAKVVGPVLAQSARLLFIGLGGWWLSTHDATAANFFALAAASMVLLGVTADAGRTQTLHLSPGTDSPSDVYLGYGSAAASSSLSTGGRVALVSTSGMVMSVYSVS